MPNRPRHSSSALNQIEMDEQKNGIYPQEVAESSQFRPPADTAGQANDWFYGTEELLDALPKTWTRSLLYMLVGFTAIALPWTMLSKVDETGSAKGRIEPKGATQKLDTLVAGSVEVVRVKEGEIVKAGQVLLELDSDIPKTELEEVKKKLEGLQNRRENLNLLKNQLMLTLRTQQQQNQAQQLAKQSQVQQARQNLDGLKNVYNIQQGEHLAKVNQMKEALESSKAASKVAQVRLRAAQEKVPRYQKAYEEGVMSKDRFKEVEQLAQENNERLSQSRSEISQAQSSLQEQQSIYEKTLRQAQSEIQQAELRWKEEQRNYQSLIHAGQLAELKMDEQLKELQTQIKNVQSEIAQTGSQITSLKIQLRQRVVRSPIDGVIFELPVTKPGAVVQPGQMVAQIAPKRTPLVIKAYLPSHQSGFLKLGMPVKIKFDAYPFQDYGVMPGRVSWISPDSKTQQTPQGQLETFELEIALAQPYIQNGSNRISLTPGQTATAEVIVRQRRIIDYILDPFKKLQQSGLEL